LFAFPFAERRRGRSSLSLPKRIQIELACFSRQERTSARETHSPRAPSRRSFFFSPSCFTPAPVSLFPKSYSAENTVPSSPSMRPPLLLLPPFIQKKVKSGFPFSCADGVCLICSLPTCSIFHSFFPLGVKSSVSISRAHIGCSAYSFFLPHSRWTIPQTPCLRSDSSDSLFLFFPLVPSPEGLMRAVSPSRT